MKKVIIIFLIIYSSLISGCNTNNKDKKNDVYFILNRVLTNYSLVKQDSFYRIPNLYMDIEFINNSNKEIKFKFNRLFKEQNMKIDFYAIINCNNGLNFKLPLYYMTSPTLVLTRGMKKSKFFKTDFRELNSKFKKCEDNYLGILFEKYTRNITIIYKDSHDSISINCSRKTYESPKENIAIE